MEIIRGKQASFMDASGLAERLAGYNTIHTDIGTGDGRYVRHIAQICPTAFAIGLDACRENLHISSRRAAANALFVIANAQAMPRELFGLAAHVTINFPWGSLLEGLLNHDRRLLEGLAAVARPNARLDMRLNGGALAECGWSLEDGAYRVWDTLEANGFRMSQPALLTHDDLKAFPTTWAKRLAYGRDPRAMAISGQWS